MAVMVVHLLGSTLPTVAHRLRGMVDPRRLTEGGIMVDPRLQPHIPALGTGDHHRLNTPREDTLGMANSRGAVAGTATRRTPPEV